MDAGIRRIHEVSLDSRGSIPLMALNASTVAPDSESGATGISASLVFLFAVSCGLAVGNIYYAQPLLETLGQVFHASHSLVGLIVTMTQIGYATGLLFIVPLGDLIENKKLVLAGLLRNHRFALFSQRSRLTFDCFFCCVVA